MAKRPSRTPARSAGPLRAAAILSIALTALAAGPAVWPASAQTGRPIPVIEIESPAQTGADDTTLAGLSQLTFGNSAEASEIFQLNDGRPQQVGGELSSVDQRLRVGWILELPQGASGRLVQFVTVSGSVSPTAEFIRAGGPGGGGAMSMSTGSSAGAGTTHRGAAQPMMMVGLQFPVFLSEVAGLVVVGLTLLILLWRHATRRARKGPLGGRLAAWLTGPSQRRRERTFRAALGQAWRADVHSVRAATMALTEAGRLVPPTVQAAVAAEVRPDSVRTFPAPELDQLHSSLADPEAAGTWVRPPASADARRQNVLCRPVRVGGDRRSQLFVDISHCDGAIALTGDPAVASEVMLSLLGELAGYHRDVTLAVLGSRQPGSVGAQLMRHSSMLAARIGPVAPANDSPVRAAAARRPITGVVAVPGDAPIQESIEVARLCSLRGSTWLALVVGDVPGAHWRWNVDGAGRMRLAALGRTVVAAL